MPFIVISLVHLLFFTSPLHSQDKIDIVQGLAVTECKEFTHGYGLYLSPGRIDLGYPIGLSIDGFVSSFPEQYKNQINIFLMVGSMYFI